MKIKMFAYITGTSAIKPEDFDTTDQEKLQRLYNMLSFTFIKDMESIGWIKIGEADIDITLYDLNELKQQQYKRIQDQIEHIQNETEARISGLKQQLKKVA